MQKIHKTKFYYINQMRKQKAKEMKRRKEQGLEEEDEAPVQVNPFL